jgi:hypothetical protein
MTTQTPETDTLRAAERGHLRAATLRLGALLGWQTHEVEAFAEALTGRPWAACGCPELCRVFDEYHEVALAIAGRMRRQRGRRGKEAGRAPRP